MKGSSFFTFRIFLLFIFSNSWILERLSPTFTASCTDIFSSWLEAVKSGSSVEIFPSDSIHRDREDNNSSERITLFPVVGRIEEEKEEESRKFEREKTIIRGRDKIYRMVEITAALPFEYNFERVLSFPFERSAHHREEISRKSYPKSSNYTGE